MKACGQKGVVTLRRRIRNEKGFTLAELLIVVAIIAVLVAVSIPIFMKQLEKSREATDIANFRAAKAAFIAEFISNEKVQKSNVVTMVYDAEGGKVIVKDNTTNTEGGSGAEHSGNNETVDDAGYSYGQGTETLGSEDNDIDEYQPESVSYKGCYVMARYSFDRTKNSHTLLIQWTKDGTTPAAPNRYLVINLDNYAKD